MNEQYHNQIVTGDALEVLKTFPDGLVQMCVTSPPYYSLRDYGVPGQIGLEETPDKFINKLVEVFHEVRRVLRPDGTLWLNIGDTYANDEKWGGHSSGKHQKVLHSIARPVRYTGLPGKNLIGIPWMLAFALRADGWILRSDIIWHKPNVLPESVEDRPTKAHEYLFLLAKNPQYYYDADAIREPLGTGTLERWKSSPNRHAEHNNYFAGRDGGKKHVGQLGETGLTADLKRNKRSVWSVNAAQFVESHFATFPPKLIEPCVLAGSRPGGIVLDPFMGAGTTALVALQHARSYLGIELNAEYVKLAEKRIETVQPDMWESEGCGA